MSDILKHVEINDLIDIQVFTPNVYKPGDIQVSIEAVEKGKQVIIDVDAARILGEVLKERANNNFENVRDPKMKKDMEEFVARMCVEWHKNGLLVIENVPDAQEPYEEAKKAIKNLLKDR